MPIVGRDPIREALEEHIHCKVAHIGFLKRMMEKALEGTLTAADEEQETMQRREPPRPAPHPRCRDNND